jgi:hypothetical protein
MLNERLYRVLEPLFLIAKNKKVSIQGFIEGTDTFPIQKCAIFCKVKEISGIARRRTSVRRTSDSRPVMAKA